VSNGAISLLEANEPVACKAPTDQDAWLDGAERKRLSVHDLDRLVRIF
jgi:hypothetical protein